MLAALACGPSVPDEQPGHETGACVDGICVDGLACVANECVDPSTVGSTGAGPADDSTGASSGVPLTSVSLLLVVDNSGSMAHEQLKLPAAVAVLTDTLSGAGIDWRLGVTTTDAGNPWCAETTPERGRLELSSCRSRLEEFVYQGPSLGDDPPVCIDACPEAWQSIASTDGRPWLSNLAGVTNLPEGLSMADALACIVPQGINGCGFESPLEAARLAIVRARTPGEDSEGFIPDDALLAVLVVTDEADCSSNPQWESIFLPEGNRVFWSNPEDAQPTSAVCWNASVTCEGSSCVSASFDVDGNPTRDTDDAVIYPVARYLDALSTPADAMFALLAGVDANGVAVYADDPLDPTFQTDFGIGPGCVAAIGRAVPPVRMREIAEALADGPPNMFSICETSYVPAMEAYAAAIVARMQ